MAGQRNRTEDWISWSISIFMLLLAVAAWMIMDERWSSLNHLPVYIYAGVLVFYLRAEKFAYKGSGLSGRQFNKWTRHLLLFFWWLLLIVPALEYSLFPRYNFAVIVAGTVLTVFGTVLRAWGVWTLGEYFSVHIEIKDNHELIEKGPYKFIRHPAYAGNIIQAVRHSSYSQCLLFPRHIGSADLPVLIQVEARRRSLNPGSERVQGLCKKNGQVDSEGMVDPWAVCG